MNYAADEYSALEISLLNPEKSDKFTEDLQKILGAKYKVLTKFQQNTSLYNSMRLEKWIIYAVLTLILIIAAFNMIGALTMLVLEKRKDISVLQSLGADKNLIKKIFLSEGLLLAFTGTGTGIVLAIIICFLQLKFFLNRLFSCKTCIHRLFIGYGYCTYYSFGSFLVSRSKSIPTNIQFKIIEYSIVS